MKKFLVILFILLWGGVKLSYSAEPQSSGELVVHITNNPFNFTITFVLERVTGTLCWTARDNVHDLTNGYHGGTKLESGEEEVYWPAQWAAPSRSDAFALGYYKLTAKLGTSVLDYFYIDYRTSTLPENFQGDLHFDYNVGNINFYRYETTTPVPTNTSIWVESPGTGHNTENLESFTPADFDIPNKNQFDVHPQLTWNHSSQPDYITGYAVYRKYSVGTIQKIALLSSSTTSYTDQGVLISEAGGRYWYTVKAVNGQRESDPTATIIVTGVLSKDGNLDKEIAFNLSQNYPNPFNPTTTIAYSIPSPELVKLKIYNTLGQEVAELVNEYFEAGSYRINFNAENLHSGIYFYTITAGKFTSTKKLLLVK